MGVCDLHKIWKKGVCGACNECKLCDPPIHCRKKDNHPSWRKEHGEERPAKRQCSTRLARPSVFTFESEFEGDAEEQSTSDDEAYAMEEEEHEEGYEEGDNTAINEMAVDDHSDVSFSDLGSVIDDDEMAAPEEVEEVEQAAPPSSAREVMEGIFSLLQLDSDILNWMSKDGHNGKIDVEGKNRRYYRAMQIIGRVVDAMCNHMCPGNAQFQLNAKPARDLSTPLGFNKLHENMQKMIVLGDRNTRVTVSSLMAASYSKEECNVILAKDGDRFPAAQFKAHGVIGKKRISNCRKIFSVLTSGKGIPRYNYTFRVDPKKLAHAMEFLQSKLKLKPGVARDVSIAGHRFVNMPVYERGGLPLKRLYATYKEAFKDEDVALIGRDLFFDVAKLLTKRGEAKAGLSTYYINFRYRSQVFVKMLQRMLSAAYPEDVKAEIVTKVNQLVTEWSRIGDFVQWEYGSKHITMDSADKSHCSFFGLGGQLTREYDNQACPKCCHCFTFFSERVKETVTFAKECYSRMETDDQSVQDTIDDNEWSSMLSATATMQKTLVDYMAHCVRAKVQFAAIQETKAELKRDRSMALIVLDHKQKILPIKFREGQVEYFGKKGMSLLGSMIIRFLETEELSGYEYQFSDYIFKGYSGQDNIQVAAAIEVIVDQTRRRFPEIKNIVIQSDNASCFASQELVPFIFHLNQESAEKSGPRISKWLFTEAQTGRGRLDTHFSYINVFLKGYVENDKIVTREEHIFQALSYNEGIAGTTVTLLDCKGFPKGSCITKKFKSTKIGTRSTHEINWSDGNGEQNAVQIVESSRVTSPEIFTRQKMMQHTKVPMFVEILGEYTSPKPPLYKKESTEAESDVEPVTPLKSDRAKALETAWSHIEAPNISEATPSPTRRSNIPQGLQYGWAKYGGNSKDNALGADCLQTLVELYNIGRNDKKKKVTAERAHQVVVDTVIAGSWDEILLCSVSKIKAFFQLTPKKMEQTVAKGRLGNDAMYYSTRDMMLEEREDAALTLLDGEDDEDE